jgi:hypothetical protein
MLHDRQSGCSDRLSPRLFCGSSPLGFFPTISQSFLAPLRALCWILYLFTIGYDNYHAEIVRETILLRCGLTANPSILKGAMRESSYERVHGEEQALAPVFVPVRSTSPESADSQSQMESVGEVDDDDQNLYSQWESVGGRHLV